MRPYEVLIYYVEDDDSVSKWGPDLVFADNEDAAKRRSLIKYAKEFNDINLDDLVVASRPFGNN